MEELILVLVSVPVGMLVANLMGRLIQVHEKEKIRSTVLGVIGAVLGGMWATEIMPDLLYSAIGAAAVMFVYYKIIGGGKRN